MRITGQLIEAATRSNLWAEPVRRDARRRLRLAGPHHRERRWSSCADIAPGGDRARAQQACDEPGCLRLPAAGRADGGRQCCRRSGDGDRAAVARHCARSPTYARAHAYIAHGLRPDLPQRRRACARRGLQAKAIAHARQAVQLAAEDSVALAHAGFVLLVTARDVAAARCGPRQGSDTQSESDDGICIPRAGPGHGRRARARDRGCHPRPAPEPARSGELPAPDGAGDFPHMASANTTRRSPGRTRPSKARHPATL